MDSATTCLLRPTHWSAYLPPSWRLIRAGEGKHERRTVNKALIWFIEAERNLADATGPDLAEWVKATIPFSALSAVGPFRVGTLLRVDRPPPFPLV